MYAIPQSQRVNAPEPLRSATATAAAVARNGRRDNHLLIHSTTCVVITAIFYSSMS